MQRSAHFLSVGVGKTATSTAVALYKGLKGDADHILILMPPILLRQWQSWLTSLGLSVTVYAASPAKRLELDMSADAILMSYNIFKNDFKRLTALYADTKMVVIVDECSAVRKPSTLNFKSVRDFTNLPNKHVVLLSATPVNRVHHCYGIIKIKSPEIYRSWTQFSAVHITSTDVFGEPNGFANLDLLARNLMRNAVRVDAEDVLDELPEIVYQPVVYDLDPAHKRLYDTLVEQKLVELDDKTLLDGTIIQRLYNELQRVILRPAEFGGEKIRPVGFDLIENTAQEAGMLSGVDTKLIIFVNFQTSNQATFEHTLAIKGLNPIQAYGVTGAQQNLKNVERFLTDPEVNVLVANPSSIGVGLNLQSVSSTILFLELPVSSDLFIQAIGRVYRQGQKRACLIKFGQALGTLQIDIGRRVMRREDELQNVFKSRQTLRAALTGR